ncbi:bacterio-opsin activator [Halovenus sp. WSH3]|uniref:Bacterio-opsin activator n=1 Tax=Halovenus carboxidivorans TaxID=2692199 RepID=A0A6B0T9A2_9EURY|nr:helix-turn-helix domain-containing protein [Halovenus carboxidivorans]MXR51440.1 bacterio-opsin activator [Halovenus carboxidivorans]
MTQTTTPESLTVVLEIPDRQTLVELLSTVEESESPVVTRDIRRADESGDGYVSVDLGELTAKQKQALELAVEAGYYERPRDADLGELGDRLAISKSAVSQRLRSAERKLIETAIRQVV